MSAPVYLGIDVAKESFEVASDPQGVRVTLPNTPAGRRQLLQTLSGKTIALIVLEATGGYERSLAGDLLQAGHSVVVANPRQVRDFARGMGKLAKTDAIDAAVLALFAQTVRPQPRPAPSASQSDLAELVTRRRQLTDLRTQEANRVERIRHPKVRKSLAKMIKTLDHQIAELDDLIQDHIQGDPDFRQKDQILQSTPGVGPQTSAMLIGHLPELGRLNRQEIAALVGVAPWDCRSGQWVGRSRIWGGRKAVRSLLYMACIAAMRFNPTIRSFCRRLADQGKPFKVVITAAMRKLLVILNTMIRTLTPWHEPQPKNA